MAYQPIVITVGVDSPTSQANNFTHVHTYQHLKPLRFCGLERLGRLMGLGRLVCLMGLGHLLSLEHLTDLGRKGYGLYLHCP